MNNAMTIKTVNLITGQITERELTAEEIAAIPAPVQPTPEQITAAVQAAVQAYLDSVAVSWNYMSILSACSYTASTIPQFKAESLALVAWRDAVWIDCYTKQAAIQGGTMAMPASPEAFVATLPAAPVRPVV